MNHDIKLINWTFVTLHTYCISSERGTGAAVYTDWCRANVGEEYYTWKKDTAFFDVIFGFDFRNAEDAVAFKLRFGL